MTAMDPKSAAAAIKRAWEKEPPPAMAPEDQHTLSYLEEVCDHLKVEKTPTNIAHVAHLMAKNDVEQHHPNEYPKALNVKDGNRLVQAVYPDGHPKQGQPVIFESAEEEAEFGGAVHDDHPPPTPQTQRPADAPIGD